MSYEKLKVVGIKSFTKKATGEIGTRMDVEMLVTRSIFLNGDALKLVPVYEKLVGKEALFPCEEGIYNNKPSLSLSGDFKPIFSSIDTEPKSSIFSK